MSEPTWYEAVDLVTPHVVRILTPRGSGTGFQFHRLKDNLVGIATAAHVIEHAHAWEDPLRIVHTASGESVLLRQPDRAVFIDEDKDTAAIVFNSSKLGPLPTQTLALAPEKQYLKVGNDIGWLGFPSVAISQLCFFGGRVSAWDSGKTRYLVDGVAINGVSGGPAFHLEEGGPVLMGVLAAYIPNRATGEALPGLAVVQDVSHLHELVKDFASLGEAQEEQSPPVEASPPASDTQTPSTPTKGSA
jgi:hypothetical protein